MARVFQPHEQRRFWHLRTHDVQPSTADLKVIEFQKLTEVLNRLGKSRPNFYVPKIYRIQRLLNYIVSPLLKIHPFAQIDAYSTADLADIRHAFDVVNQARRLPVMLEVYMGMSCSILQKVGAAPPIRQL